MKKNQTLKSLKTYPFKIVMKTTQKWWFYQIKWVRGAKHIVCFWAWITKSDQKLAYFSTKNGSNNNNKNEWREKERERATSIDSNNKDITFYGILSVQKAKIRAFSLGFVYIFTVTTCIERQRDEEKKKKITNEWTNEWSEFFSLVYNYIVFSFHRSPFSHTSAVRWKKPNSIP